MATNYLFLAILCFSLAGSVRVPAVHLLAVDNTRSRFQQSDASCRGALVRRAAAQVGIREKTGNNDGTRVEEYLAVAGLKKGAPYCSAFVSWVFKQEGFAQPRTGWSPALFPVSRLARCALPGNVFGVYFPEFKRIAHAGIIERVDGNWCITIEANTSLQGGREGEGVFRKRRHIKMIYRMADWVTPERGAK